MKSFLSLVVATLVLGGAPAFAVSGGILPQECLLSSTKAAHPDWYREGLYCAALENGYQPHSDQPPPPKPPAP